MIGCRALHAANAATWPARRHLALGGFTLGDGAGGGRRVSSARCEGEWSEDQLGVVERAMAGLGQPPQFMIRETDAALDAALEARGYHIADPTVLYVTEIAALGPAPDPMTGFAHWPPLAITEAIWAEAGIVPAGVAVMHRAPPPRCALLGRCRDRPAGAAFVGVHDRIAMLHALEVCAPMRRVGVGRNLLRHAAVWAGQTGALHLGLAVTAANHAARALYESLGMRAVGLYHYRVNEPQQGQTRATA